jgi:hypothetical protein
MNSLILIFPDKGSGFQPILSGKKSPLYLNSKPRATSVNPTHHSFPILKSQISNLKWVGLGWVGLGWVGLGWGDSCSG